MQAHTASSPTSADQACEVAARYYPALNHMLEPARTGAPDEYVLIETTLDEQLLADLVAWLRVRAGLAPSPR